jgi:hypothetical protein
MNTEICSRCLLTAKTPGITFDEEGICNYCREYKPFELQSEEKLLDVLRRFRGKRGKYDCMVGLSGGRDSTYTLWKLVNDYGMRVLAVTYDNPFMSEQAHQNIKRALNILGVDGVSWTFPGDLHKRSTTKYLKMWGHHNSSVLIPLVCAHCKTWWPGYFKVARDNEVALTVIGSNPLETASFKKAGFGGARTYHTFSNIPRILKRSWSELVANPRYLSTNWALPIRMYLMSTHSTPYIRWRYKDVTVIRLFDYLKWNEKEIESTVSKHLGWEKSREVASSWRFDCRLDYVRRLMYASTIGVTELRDLFSKMIREKQISREEALDRLRREEPVSEALVEGILNELGLRLSDLNLNLKRELLI